MKTTIDIQVLKNALETLRGIRAPASQLDMKIIENFESAVTGLRRAFEFENEKITKICSDEQTEEAVLPAPRKSILRMQMQRDEYQQEADKLAMELKELRDGKVVAAYMVETENGQNFWPASEFEEALYYCTDGKFPVELCKIG